MYAKNKGDKPAFGDVYEAPWFFDIYLRETSEALTRNDGAKGGHRYVPSRRTTDRDPGKDFALAFATPDATEEDGGEFDSAVLVFGNERRAILLSDDCEAESIARKGGRLIFASMMEWPKTETEQEALKQGKGAWRRFGLPPDSDIGWEGAVVDLSRCFAVWYEDLDKAEALYGLTEEETRKLDASWCAYATRHGPRVARDGAFKLLEMHYIGGDPEKWKIDRWKLQEELPKDHQSTAMLVADALRIAWHIEGEHLDEVSEGYERQETADTHVQTTVERLEQLSDATDTAIEALKKL